jgi:hypothetical protein
MSAFAMSGILSGRETLRMLIRLVRWAFGSKSQPDVLLALLALDVAWNVVVPKDLLEQHDDKIGIQPGLRPWLMPIKGAAIGGLLLGKRWPKFGALTAMATTAYFVVATGYHVRANDSALGTAPAVVYGGAALRSVAAFTRR